MKKVLYLSYDGLTDPLGQSQIIPYLQGLSKLGHEITILSFEKKEREGSKGQIKELLDQCNINWMPLRYTKYPPIISTLYDLVKLRNIASQLIPKKKIEIVHCRSYLTAFIGTWAKKKFGTHFLFDMRGFWADERVEGEIWNLKNPFYKVIYKFFKKKEKEFLTEADHIVSLTYKAKEIIQSRQDISGQPLPVTVIPCCVDTNHFDPAKISLEEKDKIKKELAITKEDKILTYLGSLGTWYMVEEMLLFFKELIKFHSDYKFLFITKDSPGFIEEKRKRLNIPADKIIVISSERKELPILLSVSDIAISFILPSFSKAASSPTKLGELFSMGIPVICNRGVGDVDFFLEEKFPGLLVEEIGLFAFQESGDINKLKMRSNAYRDLSNKHFCLLNGVNSYEKIYFES